MNQGFKFLWLLFFALALSITLGLAGCGDKKSNGRGAPPPPPGQPGPGTVGPNGSLSGNVWGASLTLTNKDLYRAFLKDHTDARTGSVICDYGSWWNVGTADCDNWDDAAYVYFEANNNQVPGPGAFHVEARVNSNYSWGYGSALVSFPGQIAMIDGNTRFEIRRSGYYMGWNDIVSMVSNSGVLSNSFEVRLYYNDAQFGVATIHRLY